MATNYWDQKTLADANQSRLNSTNSIIAQEKQFNAAAAKDRANFEEMNKRRYAAGLKPFPSEEEKKYQAGVNERVARLEGRTPQAPTQQGLPKGFWEMPSAGSFASSLAGAEGRWAAESASGIAAQQAKTRQDQEALDLEKQKQRAMLNKRDWSVTYR